MQQQSSGSGGRVIAALIFAAIAFFGYQCNVSHNDITGEDQHLAMTPDQEIALGLEAAPEMGAQYGGEDLDPQARQAVDAMGRELVSRTDVRSSPYRFQFHLLADTKVVNAFALPGGQVFITRALYDRLETRGQLAGVLGHEIGHVVARHGAQQMAKAQLLQGLSGAAAIGMYDPNDPKSANRALVAQMVAKMLSLKYGRDDESQSDKLGVRFMSQAGYDPRAMIGVMRVLEKATGGGRQAEFFSTHPNPEHRIDRIQGNIAELFPRGVPDGMRP